MLVFILLAVLDRRRQARHTAEAALDGPEQCLNGRKSAEQLSILLVGHGVVPFAFTLVFRGSDVEHAKVAHRVETHSESEAEGTTVAAGVTEIDIGAVHTRPPEAPTDGHPDEVDG
eukprot:CAMPEP_0170457636 /NCGR_PEP_ID=MMETSP0123-20130129/4863_1 /TAXON_ID=182087 /ORGANISM="Favella ehrenbergii, Strain Fehren 1" /LENGTH=115 /DNA_ID=CAMNT_0010721497 /DNA_START=276 /DNA_END=623 /DNA_ORIENTATION=-